MYDLIPNLPFRATSPFSSRVQLINWSDCVSFLFEQLVISTVRCMLRPSHSGRSVGIGMTAVTHLCQPYMHQGIIQLVSIKYRLYVPEIS